jgi:uncharacterized protein YeaO (DUF488 family)
MDITLKRAYEAVSPQDGYRVLVDRLWPRGVSKEELVLDEWCKDIAPSAELREWFGHDQDRFAEFRARYLSELESSDAAQQLLKRAGNKQLTLVYAAKDQSVNHAVVLQNYLKKLAQS